MTVPNVHSTALRGRPSPSSSCALEVRDLNVVIRTPEGIVNPVRGVDIVVPQNSVVGIVGESGCGKTTTIKGVLGLLDKNSSVSSARIVLDGDTDLSALSDRGLRQIRGSRIGFVAQNPFGALNPIYSIERQFLELQRAHRGRVSRAESRDLALRKLEDVGIQDGARVLSGYAHQLSGGMAQRVVIALATTLSPRLLVADEPTTGLDVTVQAQILDLISRLVATGDMSMLLVTHDLGVIAQYCDHVVVMYDGLVVEGGPSLEVLVDPQHEYTRTLIASVLGRA